MVLPAEMCVEKTSRPLKIAIVYSRNPLPMDFADQMTVAHLIAFLAERGHAVDLYNIDAGGTPSDEQKDWLTEKCRKVATYPLSRSKFAMAAATALVRRIPFQVALFDNRQMARDLAAAADDYDIIYTYYIRSGEVSRSLRGSDAKTFVAYQLSQALNTRRIAENPRNWRYKAFYSLEHRLVRTYEAKLWQDYSRSVLIGPADVDAVKESCKREGQPQIDNYVYGAHGTDLKRFGNGTDAQQIPGRVAFSGVMRTPTNIQAVIWFARNVWPTIRTARPDATWHIVGRSPAPEILELGSLDGVTVTGSVPDPAVNIAEAQVCVNPMQAGGGMQNKLIEYLASARATVATTVANEGIGAEDGRDLRIADTPQQFAAAVLHLLNNGADNSQLAENGRKFVQANWTWEAHWLKLEQDFFDAIDGLEPSRIRSPEEALAEAKRRVRA